MSDTAEDGPNDQYLYGIVFADTSLPASLEGVQGQPVRLLECERVAAVISETLPAEALGTPDDLLAHTRLLDTLAAEGPVLPLAFGTVVPGGDAVEAEVLQPREDEYYSGLQQVSGHTQYTVTVTFDRDVVMREIVDEVPEAAELRAAIAGTSEDETRPQRIQLGELMVNAFEERKPAAAEPVLDRIEEVAAEMAVHDQRQPEDVAEVAVLVANEASEAFEQQIEELARRSHPRLRFRLVGPQAPYDFVPEV